MTEHVTADWHTLLKQAPMTAHDYMHSAISDIDKMFGEGFAKKNPDLVAAYMQVCAKDFATASFCKVFGTVLDRRLGDIASALSAREVTK